MVLANAPIIDPIRAIINLSAFSLKKPLTCCLLLKYIFGFKKLDKQEIKRKYEEKNITTSNQYD
jgi:hypothetical protein